MPKIWFNGDGNYYVLFILAGVIGLSFVLTNGLLPNIKPNDTLEERVSEIKTPASSNNESLQMSNIGFNPQSVTVIPPSPTVGQIEENSSINPTSQPQTTIIAANPNSTTITPPINSSPTVSIGTILSPTIAQPIPPSATVTRAPTPAPTSSGLPALSSFNKRLLAIARSQIGDSYRMGACESWFSSSSRPGDPPKRSDACDRWDCSNFTAWVYYWATNGSFKMRSQTCQDYGDCYDISGNFFNDHPTMYTKYSYKEIAKISFGDLVYFGNKRDNKYPITTHVGLYIGEYGNCGGNDCIIDASVSGGGVSERRLSKVPKPVIGFLRPKL